MILEKVSDLKEMVSKEVIAIPLWTDTKAHPAINTPCVLYVYAQGQDILIPYNHNEAILDDDAFIVVHSMYTPSKKEYSYFKQGIIGQYLYDVDGMEYLDNGIVTNSEIFWTKIQRDMYGRLARLKNVNKAIPLLDLFNYFIPYREHIQKVIAKYKENITHVGKHAKERKVASAFQKNYEFFNDIELPTLWKLERYGIPVSSEKYSQYFSDKAQSNISKDNKVYSWYNPYTTTGRPSNRWGGVNYSALNKSDGSREAFVGDLTLIDFESFHLRLIADIIDFELPNEPIHEYLAKQYFGVSEITPEQYDQSKQKTFTLLYGDNRPSDVPKFIEKIWILTDYLWEQIQKEGWTTSSNVGRVIKFQDIENPTPAKVLNYIIQAKEMEVGISLIKKLVDGPPVISQPILYTYDSLLFNNLTDEQLEKTIEILECGGKYPVRVYKGKSYNNMVKIPKSVSLAVK